MTQPATETRTARIFYRGQVNYDELEGVNFSTLKELRHSPRRYRHRLKHRRESTSAMELGTAAHIAVLEPRRFLEEYVIWKAEDENGKTRVRRGKEWDAFCRQHAGKTIIRDAEYDEAWAMSQAIRDDELAMRYLAVGRPEVAVQWTDTHTGVLCKMRTDWLASVGGSPVEVDVKTTKDASPWSFSRDCARFSYHVQRAFYADGLEAALGCEVPSRIVSVENSEPNDVVVYRVPNDVLDVGRDEYRRLLETLKQCQKEDRWPGVADGVEQDLTLPAWCLPEEDGFELDELKGWKDSPAA